MRESEIEKYLVKKVKAMGGECRKVRWIGRKGAPDRVVMLPPTDAWEYGPMMEYLDDEPGGRDRLLASIASSVWVELKATGKKPTAAQLREHARMRRMGQRVEVIDSIEGVDELLC